MTSISNNQCFIELVRFALHLPVLEMRTSCVSETEIPCYSSVAVFPIEK